MWVWRTIASSPSVALDSSTYEDPPFRSSAADSILADSILRLVRTKRSPRRADHQNRVDRFVANHDIGMFSVAGPLERLACRDLTLVLATPDPEAPGCHEQVLNNARPMSTGDASRAGLEAEPVHLGDAPVRLRRHVEQPRLHPRRGDPCARAPVEQGRERQTERVRERVERSQRGVARAVLDLRERALADASRR